MVTSTVDGEGHARVALDLANALADLAEPVLLIDADADRPSLDDILGAGFAAEHGDELQFDSDGNHLLKRSEYLSILVRDQLMDLGPPARPSDRMIVLVDRHAARFQWIVLLGPPGSRLTDAALVARRIGAVAFTMGERTPFAVAQPALAQFARELVVGTVLRGVDGHTPPEHTRR
jgi:Mrp family chromosome partitioning ATPase